MKKALSLAVLAWLITAGWVAVAQQLQIIGSDPVQGPICMGPLGPGPCALIQQYLMQRAGQPAPPAQLPIPRNLQQIGFAPGVGPICMGPLGPGPCAAVAQYLAQLSGQVQPTTFDARQIQVVSNDPNMGPICNGPLGIGPCALLQQSMLDRLGSSPQAPPLAGLNSLNPQQVGIACAQHAGLDVAQFASCAGQQAILSPRQQAVVDCGLSRVCT
jgi:hypothetical protein